MSLHSPLTKKISFTVGFVAIVLRDFSREINLLKQGRNIPFNAGQ